MRELEGINSLAFDGLEFGRGSHGWNQKKINGELCPARQDFWDHRASRW